MMEGWFGMSGWLGGPSRAVGNHSRCSQSYHKLKMSGSQCKYNPALHTLCSIQLHTLYWYGGVRRITRRWLDRLDENSAVVAPCRSTPAYPLHYCSGSRSEDPESIPTPYGIDLSREILPVLLGGCNAGRMYQPRVLFLPFGAEIISVRTHKLPDLLQHHPDARVIFGSVAEKLHHRH